MTSILNVTRNDEGQYEITDQRGTLVEGPFDTNAAAWRALKQIDQGSNGQKARHGKKALCGEPERPKQSKKVPRKESAKQERVNHRMKVNAAKAPGWVRGVAAAKFDPAGERNFRDHKLGTFGAASEVKRIDPAEYLAAKARGEA